MKKLISFAVLLGLLLTPITLKADTDVLMIEYLVNRSGDTQPPWVREVIVGDTDKGRILGYHEYGGKPTYESHVKPFEPQDKSRNRFVNWNTKPDGSGYDFRGGRVVTKEDIEILKENGGKLYQMWANSLDLSGIGMKVPSPTILINNSSNHTSKDTALQITPLDKLSVRSDLSQTNRLQSKIIWGRLDKWGDGATTVEASKSKAIYGKITIEIDSDLELRTDESFIVDFVSPWLQIDLPDASHDKNAGLSSVQLTTNRFKKSGNKKTMEVPIKLVNKNFLA